jgi:outer membrane protein OmpA-like peptidoglycan-associated protein
MAVRRVGMDWLAVAAAVVWLSASLVAFPRPCAGQRAAGGRAGVAGAQPRTVQGWIDQGVAMNDNSDGEAECYRRALEIDPGNSKAHFNLGYVLFVRKDHAEAAVHFEACIAGDPARADAYINLGHAKAAPGPAQDLEGARKALNDALEETMAGRLNMSPGRLAGLRDEITELERRIAALKGADPLKECAAPQFENAMKRGFTRGASPYAGPRVPILLQFDKDTAALRSESRRQLDILANSLGSPGMAGVNVIVEGHASSEGASARNRELSRQRAESVSLYLQSKGVGAERLKPVGYGEDRPISPNDNEESRSRNRRVEFVNARAWDAARAEPHRATRGGEAVYDQFYRDAK